MIRLTTLTIVCLLMRLSCIASFGNVYYVSPAGSNAATGTATAPWRTIQHGMDQCVPGDTLLIQSGSYQESLHPTRGGASSAWITVRGISDSVYVDGAGMSFAQLLLLDSVPYVQVERICFRNNVHNDAQGVLIRNHVHDIALVNCKILNVSFSSSSSTPATPSTNANPMLIYGDNAAPVYNITITGCEIANCITGYSEALSVDGNVTHFEITHSTVHDITNIGIDLEGHYGICPDPLQDMARYGIVANNLVYRCQSPYASAAGIYVDGADSCVIERNVIHDCQWGVEVGCESIGAQTAHIYVRDNFIYNNATAAIALGGYDYPTGSGKVTDCYLYNNTCYHNDTQREGNGELAITYAERCDIRNNIFYAATPGRLMVAQTGVAEQLTLDYNCWYTTTGAATALVDYGGAAYSSYSSYTAGSGQDAHSIFADPRLASADTMGSDLHISFGSPCVSAGDATVGAAAGATDIDGAPRLSGVHITIGAQQGTVTGLSEASEAGLHIYPNPARDLLHIQYEQPGSDAVICLYDVLGVKVLTQKPDGLESTINVAALPAGLYLWSLERSGSAGATGRVVIQRD